eukprot:2319467-Pleurochrysis_carterae.AAC.4
MERQAATHSAPNTWSCPHYDVHTGCAETTKPYSKALVFEGSGQLRLWSVEAVNMLWEIEDTGRMQARSNCSETQGSLVVELRQARIGMPAPPSTEFGQPARKLKVTGAACGIPPQMRMATTS